MSISRLMWQMPCWCCSRRSTRVPRAIRKLLIEGAPSLKKRRPSKPKASAGAKRTVPRPKPVVPTLPPSRSYRGLWNIGKSLIACAVLVIGIVGSIVGIFGPIWPTRPAFSPGYPSFGQPLDVPFSVSNESVIFGIRSLKIRCALLDVKISRSGVGDADLELHNTISVDAEVSQDMRPRETRSYTCPFYGARYFFNIPHDYHLVEAKLGFESTYKSFVPWEGEVMARSDVFFLNNKTWPPQWTRGVPFNQ